MHTVLSVNAPVPGTHTSPPAPKRVLALAALWFAVSTGLVASGLVARLRLPIIPLLIFAPTLWLVVLFRKNPAFHAWAAALPVKGLVLYHALRAPIGLYFLQLAARGELDPRFASAAGYGDILAGGLALVVGFACAGGATRTQRFGLGLWNLFGLLDILMVVISAQYVLFFGGGISALLPLTTLPLGVVPVLIVPGVFVTHFLIFWGLWARK